MSTLAVVEEILRETAVPMSVREIVEHAGENLPTRSKTPDTVVARDLSMDIKKKGEESLFIRTSPGRYTLREIELNKSAQKVAEQNAQPAGDGVRKETEATPILKPVIEEERAGPRHSGPTQSRSSSDEESSSVPA